MKCDACNDKDATVFLTQIVEGKMHKLNLCEDCAKDKGVNDPVGFAMADLFLGIGSDAALGDAAHSDLRCSVCGFTLGDLKKNARLGCSACYDVFAATLEGMLKNMHKGVHHTGKSPALNCAKQADDLKRQLAEAIAAEQYELAATLRDKIKALPSD